MGTISAFYRVLVMSMMVLSVESTNSGHTQMPTVCPCDSNIKISPAEMEKTRQKMITSQILEKLRLHAPPNTVSKQILPAPLMEEKIIKASKDPDTGGNMDEFYAKTTEIVKFPYRTGKTIGVIKIYILGQYLT